MKSCSIVGNLFATPITRNGYDEMEKYYYNDPSQKGFVLIAGEGSDELGCSFWIPDFAFKYLCADTETTLDRLKLELSELSNKITKLELFLENIDSVRFKVSLEHKDLLLSQHLIMEEYYKILNKRIDLFIAQEES